MSGCDFLSIGDVRMVRVRNISPCTLTTPQIWRFCACWASFFSEEPFEGLCWASIFAPTGTVPVLDAAWRILGWLRWGFCAMRSPLAACRRRVGGLDGVIPPGWWRRGRASRWCGRQSADPLGEKRRKGAVLAEWVCTLAYLLSVVVCRSHANPLLQA